MSHMPCKTLRSVVRLCGVAATVTSRPAHFPWAENVITGLHSHFLTCDYMESTHMHVCTVTSQTGNVLKKKKAPPLSSSVNTGYNSRVFDALSVLKYHLQHKHRYWVNIITNVSVFSDFLWTMCRQSTIPYHLQNHFWLLWFQQRLCDSSCWAWKKSKVYWTLLCQPNLKFNCSFFMLEESRNQLMSHAVITG